MRKREPQSVAPYDDVFRTLITKCTNLLPSFLNELFYDGEKVICTPIEITKANGPYYFDIGHGRQIKFIPDDVSHIDGNDYHLECDSYEDRTILVNMVHYDALVALSRCQLGKNNVDIVLPYSGILYLRKTRNRPDHLVVTISDHYGHQFDMPIRILNLIDYTVDDLINKNLIILFPFYIFNLENLLSDYQNTNNKSRHQILSAYKHIFSYLNQMVKNKSLTINYYRIIVEMMKKVTFALTKNDDYVRKELDDFMGGHVLSYSGEELYIEGLNIGERKGEQKGEQKGERKGTLRTLIDLMNSHAISFDIAYQLAKDKLHMTEEEFRAVLEND